MTNESILRSRLAMILATVPWAATLYATDNLAMDSHKSSSSSNPFSTSASLSLKESFDDNVFLQSVGANANHQSMVTAITPAVGLGYKPSPLFNATINYSPEINVFHSASSEDFTLHRAGASLSGKTDKTAWDVSESLIWIDGSEVGPSYFGQGGAPAAGGPAIRDRRESLIERGQIRLTQTLGQWFIRPVVSGYLHHFETEHKTTAGYQNFVDRNDLNAGADLGYSVGPETWVVAGYRYGMQNQDQLFSTINPAHYDSTYHRLLAGIEGSLWDWLKLSVSAGPEFRHYDGAVASGFDRTELYGFADANLTAILTKADTVILSAKRFEQPGFSGRSTYIDSTYDLCWRHKITDKLTLGAGVRGYNTDFLKPSADRNDWIISGNVLAAYSFNKHFNAEASYSYDDAESLVNSTPGREYTRNLIAIGIKYVFK